MSKERKSYPPGVYDITNQEYHASEGISRSGISEFKKSPLHYWDRYLNPDRKPEKQSPAMTIGSAVHTLILEPHKFETEFCVLKKADFRTKAGQEYKKEFESQSNGKQIIKEEDMDIINNMVEAVKSHRLTQGFLEGASVEQSLFWHDRITGLLCKARPDIWHREKKIICDLKTARDASPESFMSAIKSGDYHIQAYMQMIGIYEVTGETITNFCFIVIPNERPHFPYIYDLDLESIKQGKKEFNDALDLMKKCFQTNDWKKERNKAQSIGLSSYALSLNPFTQLSELYNE